LKQPARLGCLAATAPGVRAPVTKAAMLTLDAGAVALVSPASTPAIVR